MILTLQLKDTGWKNGFFKKSNCCLQKTHITSLKRHTETERERNQYYKQMECENKLE
jgi:hypothetical protein